MEEPTSSIVPFKFVQSDSDKQVLSLSSIRLANFGKILNKQFKEENKLLELLKINHQASRTTYSKLVLFILEEIDVRCKQNEGLDPKTFMISRFAKKFIRKMLMEVLYPKRPDNEKCHVASLPGYSYCNKRSQFITDAINEVLVADTLFKRLFVENLDPESRLNLFVENCKSYSTYFNKSSSDEDKIQIEDEDEDAFGENFDDFMVKILFNLKILFSS